MARVSHQGFFSRIANSFIGVLIGILLVPASILLLSWNEYRTVHRTRGLLEAESVVAEVADPFEVDPALDQRLIHLSGMATTEELLSDDEFSVARRALRLVRDVEMFQWVEHEESRTRDKIGGGRETVTTYEYRQQWHTDRISSERFHERVGHTNPHPRYLSKSKTTHRASLGALELRPDLIEEIDAWQDLPLNIVELTQRMDESSKRSWKVEGNYLYFSSAIPDPLSPKIGDLRIKFRVVEPVVVSLLSKLVGNQLQPFRTSNGERIEAVQLGTVSADDMFDALRRQNAFLGWLLRAAGWLLAWLAFAMVAAPLKTLAGIFPPLGGLVGAATALLSLLLATIVASITIGLAWLAVRPILGISMLALAAIGLYWLLGRRKSKGRLDAVPDR